VITLERRTVEVDGATLEVFTGGAGGPTVCQSHPFVAQTPEGGLVDAVGDLCRLVRVNPRGVGSSSAARTPRTFSFAQQVADLEAVRQRLGIERWAFHGEEGGGCLGPLYALQAPDALSALIVAWMGPSGRRIATDARSVLSPSYPAYREILQAAPLRRHSTILPSASAVPSEWLQLREGLWMLTAGDRPVVMLPFELEGAKPFAEAFVSAFDVQAQLEEIRMPALVVANRDDPVVPLAECQRLDAGLSHSQMIVLEASGHGERSLGPGAAEQYRVALRRFLLSGSGG
jgi:pimeloyl-ACP methyl ester carboxylesterase